MCCSGIKRLNLDLLWFSRLQMVVLKVFVLFLKQESSSRAQGHKAQDSKAGRMKKAVSKVSQAMSKVKELFNFLNFPNL